MHTIYILKAKDLDQTILKGIKQSYKDKQIEISVRELDETEYLMKSEANRERLLRAIRNVKRRRNLIPVDVDVHKKRR